MVRWLREKIEPDPSQPIFIHTVRGTGYRLSSNQQTIANVPRQLDHHLLSWASKTYVIHYLQWYIAQH
jgi:DNA-binding winged helix-turn-helix (wHTH) protein